MNSDKPVLSTKEYIDTWAYGTPALYTLRIIDDFGNQIPPGDLALTAFRARCEFFDETFKDRP